MAITVTIEGRGTLHSTSRHLYRVCRQGGMETFKARLTQDGIRATRYFVSPWVIEVDERLFQDGLVSGRANLVVALGKCSPSEHAAGLTVLTLATSRPALALALYLEGLGYLVPGSMSFIPPRATP